MLIERVESGPARLDISAYQGDQWVLPLRFEREDGTPVDITGMTFELQVRRRPIEAPAASGSFPPVDGPAGTVTLTFDAATMAALSGAYVYDVQAGEFTVLHGVFEVTPQITREVTP